MPRGSLDCQQVSTDMVSLLDGELGTLRAAEINAHFATCAACARFYQSLRTQLVLHQWDGDEVFDLDDAEQCRPDDIPAYDDLAERLRLADLETIGRMLYEILKAEFLYDYGDGIRAASEPIADPRAERRRGADLVEELRDWHDADRVEGIDLADVARRLRPPTVDDDRLSQLIAGMAVVGETVPALRAPATYYQALAHVKAGREPEAAARFQAIVDLGPSPLVRPARIALATLPALLGGRPDESIPALQACLAGDASDVIVLYNLAKAHFIKAGGRLSGEGRRYLEAARAQDARLIERQLSLPSERPLRLAWARPAD
ncbi:MAG: zf-HC2 domain-containing protein [Myxococcales bacterium]|nr:zf-HC2 domain-containing protein [Myxococcales bacterium]